MYFVAKVSESKYTMQCVQIIYLLLSAIINLMYVHIYIHFEKKKMFFLTFTVAYNNITNNISFSTSDILCRYQIVQ